MKIKPFKTLDEQYDLLKKEEWNFQIQIRQSYIY